MKNINLPSNKKFAYSVSFMFFIITIFNFYNNFYLLTYISFFLGIILLLTGIIRPNYLSKANKFWMDLGQLLGRLINPLILALIFFFIITPVALITRFFGRDELRIIKQKNNCESYWIECDHKSQSIQSFRNQF